jgi:hypothetical protein
MKILAWMSFTNAIDENYNPEAIRIIRDEEIHKILEDPNFEPIIVSLREGPMTIEEITRRYNVYVEVIGSSNDLTDSEIRKRQKSEMTIYRYIKDLETANIVVQAGRQIESGKTTTKALYGRSATLFYPLLKTSEWWESTEAEEFVDVQVELLKLYLPKSKVSKTKLKQLLIQLDAEGDAVGAKIFEENKEKVSKIIKDLTFKEIDKHLQRFSYLITLFESEKYLKDLKDCCGE